MRWDGCISFVIAANSLKYDHTRTAQQRVFYNSVQNCKLEDCRLVYIVLQLKVYNRCKLRISQVYTFVVFECNIYMLYNVSLHMCD